MFKIIEDPQFVEEVRVNVPDGTGWRQEVLKTRFRVVPISEIETLEADGGARTVLDRIVVEFQDLADADGKPVSGTEWRARLLEFAFIRTALIQAYYVAQSGLRLGNSAPSAAPGPAAH